MNISTRRIIPEIKLRNRKYLLLIVILATIVFTKSYSVESIPITISPDRDKIIFDGKWTFYWEWKRTSLTNVDQNGNIELRTAHQGDFIYIFVDDLADVKYTKGDDKAVICFDTRNDKSTVADSDDYCFISALGNNNVVTLQGNDALAQTSYMKKISNPVDLIGVGGISNENDRYSLTPHAGYEFKIPTNFVGRSNNYGFYVLLYHAYDNTYHSWPENTIGDGSLHVAIPSKWGNLVSPDSSLPEFPLPVVMLVLSLCFIIYLTKNRISKICHVL